MKDSEIVHIIIPTYNYKIFITDALESAIKQTYKNITITVLDDGSTDNTFETVSKYLKKYNNINYEKNETNIGQISTLNKGLSTTKTKYAVILAADDILHKNFIAETVKKIKKYNVGLVFGGDVIIDKKGKTVSELLIKTDSCHKDACWFFKDGVRIPAISGVLFDVEKVRKIKLTFDEDIKRCPDVYFWLRIGEKFGTYYIGKALVKKRLHGTNSSYGHFRERIEDYDRIINDFLSDHPYYYENKNRMFKICLGCALFAIRFNERKIALNYLRKSIRYLSLKNISFKYIGLITLVLMPKFIRKMLINYYDYHKFRIAPPYSLTTSLFLFNILSYQELFREFFHNCNFL